MKPALLIKGNEEALLMEKWFWRWVDTTGDCWIWKGYKTTGYGGVHYRGHRKLAHRLAWELFVGPIPRGMLICHHCDNPPCCNPSHLFVGTNTDNVRDAKAKGRHSHGERCPLTKLSEQTVLQIRKLHLDGLNLREIAELVSAKKSNVHMIVSGKTWRHLLLA